MVPLHSAKMFLRRNSFIAASNGLAYSFQNEQTTGFHGEEILPTGPPIFSVPKMYKALGCGIMKSGSTKEAQKRAPSHQENGSLASKEVTFQSVSLWRTRGWHEERGG